MPNWTLVFIIARWFAKRFLHPEIVAEYGYIFLWDEDLGVESFHPEQYVECKLFMERGKRHNMNIDYQNGSGHQFS